MLNQHTVIDQQHTTCMLVPQIYVLKTLPPLLCCWSKVYFYKDIWCGTYYYTSRLCWIIECICRPDWGSNGHPLRVLYSMLPAPALEIIFSITAQLLLWDLHHPHPSQQFPACMPPQLHACAYIKSIAVLYMSIWELHACHKTHNTFTMILTSARRRALPGCLRFTRLIQNSTSQPPS